MSRGFYSAVAGMLTAVRRLEVVINNVANVQTPGFKAERTASTTFEEQLLMQVNGNPGTRAGQLVLSNAARAPELDLSQGALQQTGRTLDVALDGPGFIAVESEGGTAYTRDGSLGRDSQGFLATSTGRRVLGATGPISLPPGELGVRGDGAILVDDRPIATLRIVEFAPGQEFNRLGLNLLSPKNDTGTISTRTTVHQGFLEGSNVDLTGTMASMLELQRAYESNQRMIQYHDQMADKAANDIARPV